MLTITEKVTDPKVIEYNVLSQHLDPNKTIMFDIETTGLSPLSSIVYLIGINYYKDNSWYIDLLFNDDGRSEPEIISRFMDLLGNYENLMHFNGDTFDINFVSKRLAYINAHTEYDIPNNFNKVNSIDLYKMIKPYKNILGLPNCKQKTIEEYLGIHRIDEYNGGQLIDIYFDYLASHSDRLKSLLIQHNHDDMEGMFYLTSIYTILEFFKGGFLIHNISTKERNGILRLVINLKITKALPADMSYVKGNILINTFQDTATISIPLLCGSLKYFFENAADYIYIEELDTAVHKSLKNEYSGYTVTKAKKSNCYTNCEGYFAICKSEFDNLKMYKYDNKSKDSYVMLSDDFIGDSDKLLTYAKDIVSYMTK